MENTQELSKLPNFVSNLFINAWNARSNEALSLPVFLVSYKNNEKFEWGPGDNRHFRKCPDFISIVESGRGTIIQESTYEKKIEKHKSNTKTSMSGSFSGGMYSGSLSASLEIDDEKYSSTEYYYYQDYKYEGILDFERVGSPQLVPSFILAVKNLPEDISNKVNRGRYFKFMADYGTHFFKRGRVGGVYIMNTRIRKSLINSINKLIVASEVSGSIGSAISGGEAEAKASFSKSSFLEKVNESSKLFFDRYGGAYTDKSGFQGWYDSLFSQGELLIDRPDCEDQDRKTVFESISSLFDSAGFPEKIGYMDVMIDDYLTGVEKDPSIFQYGESEVNLEHSDEHHAENDIFVIGSINGVVGGNSTTQIKTAPSGLYYYTDDHPRMQASHSYETSGLDSVQDGPFFYPTHKTIHNPKLQCWVPYASFAMPSPISTKFMLENGNPAGVSKGSHRIVNLVGLNGRGFGAWESRELNAPHKAQTDGFLIANVDWNECDGARGFVLGQIMDGFGAYITHAGASQHYYNARNRHISGNSFCLPISKGANYKVKFEKLNSGNKGAKAQAFFIPLEEDALEFGELQKGNIDELRLANEDGFLLAYLEVDNNDGARGFVDLFCSAEKNDIKKNKITSTSVHSWLPGDVWVPHNSAIIPVPKDHFHLVTLQNHDGFLGYPKAKVFWIPILKV